MPKPQTTITPTPEERELRAMIAHEVRLQHATMTVFEAAFLARLLARENTDYGEVGINAAVVGFLAGRAMNVLTVAQAAETVR